MTSFGDRNDPMGAASSSGVGPSAGPGPTASPGGGAVAAAPAGYEDVVSVGVDLGTSTSKFCDGDRVLCFLSVAGEALTDNLEGSWRSMNRSLDRSWLRNLSIWDERRQQWRYMGAMARSSRQAQWFTETGVLQKLDDAFLALLAGLFLLGIERGKPLTRVALGFGVPIKAGEHASEAFVDQVSDRLLSEGDRRVARIKAKNVATNEIQEVNIEILFWLMQFQAYGAYMVLLFSRFSMDFYNTYIIDIGHGTWISLPVIDNEADVALTDSEPAGMHTITSNLSRAIFEKSGGKLKVPEQRLMERIAAGTHEIELPGAGVFRFGALLDAECEALAESISKKVRVDVAALGRKGVTLDYIAIVGGGSHLLFKKLKRRVAEFFGWNDAIANDRIVGNEHLPVDCRYVNAAGLMLLARDQVALDLDQDVDPTVNIVRVVTDAAT